MRTTTPGLQLRTVAVALAAAIGLVGSIVFLSSDPATAASKCASLTKSVHLFVDAKRGVNILTYNTKRFAALKKSGYADKGVLFKGRQQEEGPGQGPGSLQQAEPRPHLHHQQE